MSGFCKQHEVFHFTETCPVCDWKEEQALRETEHSIASGDIPDYD